MNSPANIVLIIGGGIAAYRALELIRLLVKQGHAVHPVLTRGAREFITPLSAAALAGRKAHDDLFSLTDEVEMGHIRLAREADMVVVAPATANLMARAAHGLADDLATAVLLATDAPVLFAPAMNPHMWAHAATCANVELLRRRGAHFIGPEQGEVACGEHGEGRMAEPQDIATRVQEMLAMGHVAGADGPLAGQRVLITAGPTHEPIDPVRVLANRSSGRMGYALAQAARKMGAEVVLVSGPVALAAPEGVSLVRVETAQEMLQAVMQALPVDMAVFTAAVADWRVRFPAAQKLKKGAEGPPVLELEENPDILATVAALPGEQRPRLVVGFAAETQAVEEHARAKLARKGADVMVANDVSPRTGILGGTETELLILAADGQAQRLERASKEVNARRLMQHLAAMLAERGGEGSAGHEHASDG